MPNWTLILLIISFCPNVKSKYITSLAVSAFSSSAPALKMFTGLSDTWKYEYLYMNLRYKHELHYNTNSLLDTFPKLWTVMFAVELTVIILEVLLTIFVPVFSWKSSFTDWTESIFNVHCLPVRLSWLQVSTHLVLF